jgi:hypothetical protein
MNGGADIVSETRERESRGASSAADGVGSLDDEHSLAAPRELDGRGQPIGPGTDYDCIVAAAARVV